MTDTDKRIEKLLKQLGNSSLPAAEAEKIQAKILFLKELG